MRRRGRRTNSGLKGWIAGLVMRPRRRRVPSANRITLLRDADGDGVAEITHRVPQGPNSPFGMALVGDDFYVANTDAIVRFPYQGATPDHRSRARRSPTCRPGRSTITGPRA